MPYARPTLTQLIDRAQQDVQDGGLQGADPLLDPSVLLILSYAIAAISYEHYGYQDYIARMATPAGATGEYATLWGALVNIFRKDATAAVIAVAFTGNPHDSNNDSSPGLHANGPGHGGNTS
ncbi:MAG: hypothetical protein ABF706_10580, partial [Novacetimonas hansenii]